MLNTLGFRSCGLPSLHSSPAIPLSALAIPALTTVAENEKTGKLPVCVLLRPSQPTPPLDPYGHEDVLQRLEELKSLDVFGLGDGDHEEPAQCPV